MSEEVLVVEQLSKKIGKRTLVDQLSFSVKKGEVFGFLGPNGAGKTTTIRMLVGLIKPTEGSISIAGHDIRKQYKKAISQVGSIVENPELYTYLTGWENLKQFARMQGNVDDARIEEIVKMVHLDTRIHERVKNYSLGMKQRLGIAQALLGNPSLLILDEPTNGLDPMGIRELREFIRKLVEESGISVFISSHLLSEIQLLCDRVAIIHHGKMITVSAVSELVEKTTGQVQWKTSSMDSAIEKVEEAGIVVSRKEDTFLCKMSEEEVSKWTKQFIKEGIDILMIQPVVPTLEDLFVELTGGESVG